MANSIRRKLFITSISFCAITVGSTAFAQNFPNELRKDAMNVYRTANKAASDMRSYERNRAMGDSDDKQARASALACIETASAFVKAHPELKTINYCPNAPKSCEALLADCQGIIAQFDAKADGPSEEAITKLKESMSTCGGGTTVAQMKEDLATFRKRRDEAFQLDPKLKTWAGPLRGGNPQEKLKACEDEFLARIKAGEAQHEKIEAEVNASAERERQEKMLRPAPKPGKLHSASLVKVLMKSVPPTSSTVEKFKIAKTKIVITHDQWEINRHAITNQITSRHGFGTILARDTKGKCWRSDSNFTEENSGKKFKPAEWAPSAAYYYEYDCSKAFGK